MSILSQINQIVTQSSVNLIAAISILLIGVVIGNFLGKLTRRILQETELEKILKKSGIIFPLEQILGSLVKYIIYFFALVMALNQVGLTATVFNTLLIIILILIAISIVLAIKDFVPNFIAGILIHVKYKLRKGNKIKVRNVEGTISEIDMIETKIITNSNDTIWIPNSMLTKNIVLKKK